MKILEPKSNFVVPRQRGTVMVGVNDASEWPVGKTIYEPNYHISLEVYGVDLENNIVSLYNHNQREDGLVVYNPRFEV